MVENNNTITELIKTLGSYGVGWLLLGLILLGIFLILYKSILSNPKIQDAIAFWFSSKIYKVGSNDIKRHPFFSDKSKMQNKVDLLSFKGESLKTKVFRLLFSIKLKIDTLILTNFIKADYSKLSKHELHIKMCEAVESMKRNFNISVKSELIKLCEKELKAVIGNDFKQIHAENCAKEIFYYVMYEKGGFNEYRTYRIESLLFDIELIRDSPIYDNNNERIYQFISTTGHSIEKAVMRAAKIFQDFNGEIAHILHREIERIRNT